MNTLQKIYEIAVDVREVCLELSRSSLSQDMDFYDIGNELSAMCACASWILKNELRRHGISSSVLWGEFVDDKGQICGGHCWVKWKNYYIDLTARQFSWFFDEDPYFEDVMLFDREKDTCWSKYYTNPRTVHQLCVLSEWPDSQNPACFVVDKKVRKFIRDRLDSGA